MKIAFLTPEYPHPKTGTSGGIGTSIKNLAAGLSNAGVSVSILIYGQDRDDTFDEGGITFYRIKAVKLKGLSRLLTQKKIERRLNTLVGLGKIDIVEAPDWTGITSFINPACPVVIKLNGSDTYFCHLDNRRVKWINRFHEKRALKNADALLSVSRFTANLTNELFGLRKDFVIIPNSVDISKFDDFGHQNVVENTILYFGTLIRKKGLLELPMIFNRVYERNGAAKLLLVGRDSSDILTGNPSVWKMMQPLFTPEALQNVSWVGGVSYDEIKNYIRKAAVCVFPTFAEALPVSWIEAMAMQKAIVASDIGWASEMLENGKEGFLVHPQSHTEFAGRIVEFLADPSLRIRLGEKARTTAINRFGTDAVTKQHLAFYQNIVKPS